MSRYRYVSCHAVTRQQLDPSLRLSDPSWSWTVGGNGTLTAKIAVPDDAAAREQLRAATQPKAAAIYVKDATGRYPWGGPVVSRTWNPNDGTISIAAMEWRAWMFKVPLAPLSNMTADIQYVWTSVDQTQIARDIASYVLAGGTTMGSPSMLFGSEALSGKTRDLSVWGTAFKRAGELLDTMANRDGGFEWSIETRPHPVDGLPQPYFVTYYPQRGALVSSILLRRTNNGGNLLSYGDVPEDFSTSYDRFWTTGVGQAPDQLFAQDTSPDLPLGRVLRFESNTSYSNVSDRSTLASHARANRKFYAPGTNLLPISLSVSKPDVDSYGIGDRVPLSIHDRWLDLELPAVRIVEKKVSMSGAGHVELTVDVTDYELPEVDPGGAV